MKLEEQVDIREAAPGDLGAVLEIERAAFGREEEARLVSELLDDPSARPVLSLLALSGGRAIGHILFTAAAVDGAPEWIGASILAPLAVIPDFQRQGIGGKLIRRGLKMLSASGTGLVFLVGHPGYYPRFGFTPAGAIGFQPPFPLDARHQEAGRKANT